MKPLRHPLLIVLFASMLGLVACTSAPEPSKATALTASLAGASEVPPVMATGTGMLDASLAPGSLVLTWTLSYAGLSGPPTGAHFHGPALAGANAGVVVPITGPLTSPVSGRATLTLNQAAEITAGRWYVNLHTAAHPNGEIRGQVGVRP